MYISLKWKSVVFLSLVLISMTVAWGWQTITKQIDAFQVKLNQDHIDQTTLLSELISDSYLKLSQFSQLIAEKPIVRKSLDYPERNGELKAALEKDWLAYNINLGLDFLAIFDKQNNSRGEVHTPDLMLSRSFHETLIRELTKSTATGKPYSFVYCEHLCLLVVLEPFINDNGQTGTIALAQNMADVVRIFFNFSGAGLGILVGGGGGDVASQAGGSGRFLDSWGLLAWAVSDFNNVFPVLSGYSARHSLAENKDNELFNFNEKSYLVKSLTLPKIKVLGSQSHLVSVNDETVDYTRAQNNIKRGLITGILGLVGAEIALLILLSPTISQLQNISNALHLLPQQEFAKAIEKVKGKKAAFPDELSALESSTAFVAEQLERLNVEVNLRKESLKEQIHALTRSRSFLTRLFDNAQIFIITQDFDFNILSTNKKFDSLYNHIPKSFRALFGDESEAEEFEKQMRDLKSKKVELFQQEIHQIDKNSRDMIITWTHAMVENEQGEEILLSIGMDQTQQKKAERDLRWMANHDGLTSVGNRRYFNAAFSQILGAGLQGALVFIDINRFKQINDIYGHSAGDQVLIEMSGKLRKLLRSSDVICRFAGDEFTAILTNIDAEGLPSVLDKLTQELNGSIKTVSGRVVSYSVSVGASVFPDHGNEPQTLIINSDMAMYNAKKKGLGHWHIFDANDERIVQLKHDHNLILTIKNALKNSAFKLVYQPILDIKQQEISHYEVLVRMYDEDGDIVSPALFIPVAERAGEIRRIDEWVIDHALEEMNRLRNNGMNFKFSINVSAPTMQADDFPQMVFDAVQKYGVPPDCLVIELTETAYIENFQQVLKNLKQVTEKGVRVALDDFGVGFSSFNYLKMLPLSYVKLDGSYIQHLAKNSEDQVFVKSMAAIINAFGMETIAEYVEDHETLQILASLGVTHGQGYYIGRPESMDKNTARRLQG